MNECFIFPYFRMRYKLMQGNERRHMSVSHKGHSCSLLLVSVVDCLWNGHNYPPPCAMWLCRSSHGETVKSVSPPFNLGWPYGLLRQKRRDRRDTIPVFVWAARSLANCHPLCPLPLRWKSLGWPAADTRWAIAAEAIWDQQPFSFMYPFPPGEGDGGEGRHKS